MVSKENFHKARHERRRSCLSSCFSASLVSDDSDESTSAHRPQPKEEVSSWTSLSSSFKKKVSVAGDVSIGCTHTSLDRLHKAKSNKKSCKSQVQPAAATNINTGSQNASLQKFSAGPMPQSVRTRSGCLGSTGPNVKEMGRPTARHDHVLGLLILALTLTLMLVCGRTCTVACLCACFYLLPLLARPRRTTEESTESKDPTKMDMDSAQYKKRVVLDGLLERNGHKFTWTK